MVAPVAAQAQVQAQTQAMAKSLPPSKSPDPEQSALRFDALLRKKAKADGEVKPEKAPDAAPAPLPQPPARAQVEPSPSAIPNLQPSAMADTNPGLRPKKDTHETATSLSVAAPLVAEAPAPVPVSGPTTAADRAAIQARSDNALQLSQRMDYAHAKPAATQLLLPVGEAAVAQALLSRTAADAPLNITLVPSQVGLTTNTLDELRRRLAEKGLVIGEVRLADSADAPAL